MSIYDRIRSHFDEKGAKKGEEVSSYSKLLSDHIKEEFYYKPLDYKDLIYIIQPLVEYKLIKYNKTIDLINSNGFI